MFHGHPDFTHDSPKFRKGVTDASHASVTPVSHHDLWNGSPTFYRRPCLTSRYGLKKKERLDVSLTQPLHDPTSGWCSAINIKQSEKLCIAPSQHVILQCQDGSPIGVVPSCPEIVQYYQDIFEVATCIESVALTCHVIVQYHKDSRFKIQDSC